PADAFQGNASPLAVGDFEGRAVVVAEVELDQIAVQVARAVLVDALHAALEDREEVFGSVNVGRAPDILLEGVVGLDDAAARAHYGRLGRFHGLPDTVGHEPSRLVGDAQHAVELVGGHALLR